MAEEGRDVEDAGARSGRPVNAAGLKGTQRIPDGAYDGPSGQGRE